jgi:hypothetical protein
MGSISTQKTLGDFMAQTPLFAGLVVDENDQPVNTHSVGNESFYVVNDAGFLRHIPSEQVDRQVLNLMKNQIAGNEDMLSEQTAKMLGQEDIFTRAMISNQLKNLDQQFEMMLQSGIPEGSRAYLGMTGFKVVINIHGEVIQFIQPSAPPTEGE